MYVSLSMFTCLCCLVSHSLWEVLINHYVRMPQISHMAVPNLLDECVLICWWCMMQRMQRLRMCVYMQNDISQLLISVLCHCMQRQCTSFFFGLVCSQQNTRCLEGATELQAIHLIQIFYVMHWKVCSIHETVFHNYVYTGHSHRK